MNQPPLSTSRFRREILRLLRDMRNGRLVSRDAAHHPRPERHRVQAADRRCHVRRAHRRDRSRARGCCASHAIPTRVACWRRCRQTRQVPLGPRRYWFQACALPKGYAFHPRCPSRTPVRYRGSRRILSHPTTAFGCLAARHACRFIDVIDLTKTFDRSTYFARRSHPAIDRVSFSIEGR